MHHRRRWRIGGRKEFHGLGLAMLEHLEVVDREAGNRRSLPIRDHNAEVDQIDTNTDGTLRSNPRRDDDRGNHDGGDRASHVLPPRLGYRPEAMRTNHGTAAIWPERNSPAAYGP